MAASLPIRGRRVAITGGARGIGLAIAQALTARDARVALGDLDADAAVAAACGLGGGAVGLPLDVTSSESFAAFVAAAEAAFAGPLDVLVNNAGIMWVGAFDDEPETAALRQLDVNLHGVIRGMKAVAPAMRARGAGHIVNVASAASKVAPAGEATYAASKHAAYGYSLAVREELRGTGVEVSVIMPVVVETELAAGTAHGRGKRLAPSDVADAVVGALERPRLEVFIPREIALLTRLVAVLPQRARDVVNKALVPDQVRETDQSARRAYEERKGL